jgi:histidinol-phosphate aminotransferase
VLRLGSYERPSLPKRLGRLVLLNSNENPYGPSPKVIEEIRASMPLLNRYPTDEDKEQVRNRLADYVGLGSENVVLGNGSDDLIDVVIRVFVETSDEVVIPTPTFSMYEILSGIAGGMPRRVQARPDMTWSLGAVLDAMTNKTKMIFLGNPNNPTGKPVDLGHLDELLRRDVIVVVDEAYVEFGARSVSSLVTEYENLVVLRTFSKVFGLAGLRLGYALCSRQVAKLVDRANLLYSVNVLALKAAGTALSDLSYAKEIQARIASGREYLYSRLKTVCGVDALPSVANFVLVNLAGTGCTSKDVTGYLMSEGVVVRDCSSIPGCGDKYVRVTVGTLEELELFVNALKSRFSGG